MRKKKGIYIYIYLFIYLFIFLYFLVAGRNEKKKKNTKKNAGTEWATTYFNMGTVSQYKHCIVTWWFGVQFWLREGVL